MWVECLMFGIGKLKASIWMLLKVDIIDALELFLESFLV
jgi:hypothetical protein